jgi:hypothetical protein
MVVVMSIIGTISCRIHVWYECDEISWGYVEYGIIYYFEGITLFIE